MTGMDAAVETRRRERPSGGGSGAARELAHSTWVIARRGLAHMRREPEALADATIQPIMFTVLFAYVFGGAIKVPDGGSYKEFLMGGIFAQTLTFSLFGTAMALASDRKNGGGRPLPLVADPARRTAVRPRRGQPAACDAANHPDVAVRARHRLADPLERP
jgi:hypothetical protein